MITETEHEVVKRAKVHYFGAYLACAFLDHSDFREEVEGGLMPERKYLEEKNQRMRQQRVTFDMKYGFEEIEPLKTEQTAWNLLSPKIREHTEGFKAYIEIYRPDIGEAQRLLAYLNAGWSLLQKWNVISKSYSAKYDQRWDLVEERETKVRELIAELSG